MEKHKKKIGFCITCMNRTHHLKETLIKNIEDNYFPDDVEFVLLDYNSSDDLEEWVRGYLTHYIDIGILAYYKICTPTTYMRSHSRNIAFRLSDAKIVCNLDADNFLGKGFAEFIINEFNKEKNIFYTSIVVDNIFGRVCVLKNDFVKIHGYNEAFTGYGYEDCDLFNRLRKIGLEQKEFYKTEFYRSVDHSDEERVSEEYYAKNIYKIYLSYINPYTTILLFFLKNGSFETGAIVDNLHLNRNIFDFPFDRTNYFVDSRFRIIQEGDWVKGTWHETKEGRIILNINNQTKNIYINENVIMDGEDLYYELVDKQIQTQLLIVISDAKNFKETIGYCNNDVITNPEINKNGYGRGIVYKNFDYNNEIILS